MILICQSCAARYLVPASVFANGPRQVRCARCGKEWLAGVVDEKPAPQPKTTEPQKEKPVEEKNAEELVAPPPLTEPLRVIPPIPPGSSVPAVWHRPWRRWILAFSKYAVALFVLVSVVFVLLSRDSIVARFPAAENFYRAVGYRVPAPGDGFSLQNISSERRFEEGNTVLSVSGDVRNDTSSHLAVPAIEISAMGASGSSVKTWVVEPPVEKLESGKSVMFRSVVPSPESAVAEITLRFVEKPAEPKVRVENKASVSKTYEDRASEAKPAETKTGETKPVETKTGEPAKEPAALPPAPTP
jgi:predicted Zn finger-like uncharacterized protein